MKKPCLKSFDGPAVLQNHKWAFVVLLAAAFLLFFYLDNQVLWQDEAETAMLAKSVLRYGYPRGYYGDYLINPAIVDYGSFGPGQSWIYHSWLPFYLAAGSFKLFGFTTWAARFPFALIGWFTLVLCYLLSLELFRDRKVAALGLLLTSTSILICLLFRQCRYYSPQAFFILAAFYLYLKLIQQYSSRLLWLIPVTLLALFHTTWGFFVPTTGWLCADLFVFKRYRNWPSRWLKHAASAAALLGTLTLPWFLICHPETHSAVLTLTELRKNVEFAFRMINKYVFPFLLNAVLLFVIAKRSKPEERASLFQAAGRWAWFVLPFIAVNTVFSFIFRHRMIRYFIHLFPVYYMIQAWILAHFARKTKLWLAVLTAALIHFTNITGDSAQHLFGSPDLGKNIAAFKEDTRFYFLDYLYEMTHRYEGPVSRIVDYLKQHAKPGETVKIPVAAEPESVQFYLPELKVENARFFSTQDFPDWIVPRDYWVRQELLNADPEKLPQYEAYLDEIGRRYERIVLDTYDIIWENRPDDIGYHKFRTVTDGLYRTMIYKKLSDEEYAHRLKEFKPEKVDGKGFDRKPLIPVLASGS